MIVLIRFSFIFLVLTSCVQLQDLCSSYFTCSHKRQSLENADKTAEFNSATEISCALRCNTKSNCDKATFNRDTKKCSLYKHKDKDSAGFHASYVNAGPRIVTLRKVFILPVDDDLKGSCVSVDAEKDGNTNDKDNNDDDDDGDNADGFSHSPVRQPFASIIQHHASAGASCSDILRQDSSSPDGFYNITIGTFLWETWCRMSKVPGCGDGGWTLIMSINGSKKTFAYDSPQWASKSSYQTVDKRQEFKLPGYWLNSFSRICAVMKFPKINKVTIMLNYSASSLYSAFNGGTNKTWKADFSTWKQLPWTPPNMDTSCLVQGSNLLAQHPLMTIRSRVGVQSQPQNCPLPYLVRGFGIGYQPLNQGIPEISCGEIISSPPIQTYPAFCRIYVQ